jgi:hypothetical protein
MTNLEKLHSYNADEMADFMLTQRGCITCVIGKRCTSSPFSKFYNPTVIPEPCKGKLIKWLNEEAKE